MGQTQRQIAREALTATGLRARFAAAQPGMVYRMEVSDGQVVIQTMLARTVKNRRA